MTLIALGVFLVAIFVGLSETALSGNGVARAGAALEALVLGVAASYGLLAALALFAFKCDESCDENRVPDARSGEWWHSQDAWQWWAQLGVATLGCVGVWIALIQTARGRHRRAAAWMAVAGVSFALWAGFLAPLGERFGI